MKFANQYGYSDVTPFEVIRTVSEKTLEVRRMLAVKDDTFKLEFHAGGFLANCSNQRDQRWHISSDSNAKPVRIRLSKDGFWKSADGSKFKLSDNPIRFYDYNF